jgi:hypothetical protein
MTNRAERFIQAFELRLNEAARLHCSQLGRSCMLGKISVYGVTVPHDPRALDYIIERDCLRDCPIREEEISSAVDTFIVELADAHDMDVECK